MQSWLQSDRNEVRKQNLKQFELLTEKVYDDIETRCFGISVNEDEVLSQEQSVFYIDLASECSMGCNWRKHALYQLYLGLPLECREYLVAEREVPDFSLLGQLRRVSVEVYESFLEACLSSITFKNIKFRQLEQNILEKLCAIDIDVKKREIRRYLNSLTNHSTAHFNAVYRMLVKLCTDPPLDCELTVHLLNTLCVNWKLKALAFELVPDARTLEVLLCHAKKAGFDFWGLWLRNGSFQFNPVVDYVSSDTHTECARVLLKHGFQHSIETPVYETHVFGFVSRRVNNLYVGDFGGLLTLLTRSNPLRMMLTIYTYLAFADFPGSQNAGDKIRTLVYLTLTLPEPYITPYELYYFLRGIISPNFTINLMEACDRYKSSGIYVDDFFVYQPRRLTHLCRCRIRKSLAENMKLPEGVGALGVSKRVRDFLTLQY